MEILFETIHDTWMMIPILFITYCILEVFERRPQSDDDSMFYSLQKYGPIFGALVGLIPQCGFSILAAMLFLQNNITMGTLIAVMIATSDEAIPILLSNPSLFPTLIQLLISKFIIALVVGYIVDFVINRHQSIIKFDDMESDDEEYEEDDEESSNACPCCYTQYPLPVSAALRSLKIFGFIFVTTLVLSFLIEYFGMDTISKLLLKDSFLQPVIASIFGFIPNCAITVVLAQLYVIGSLQFGSLLAGLCTNAGLGLICLIRYGGKKEDIIKVVSILFIFSSIVGILFLII